MTDRWGTFSLAEQLGNIGSEVGRAARAKGMDENRFRGATSRALDLFDRTLDDARWRGRLREVGRARELFCEAAYGKEVYGTSLEDLERYFMQFAMAARRQAEAQMA